MVERHYSWLYGLLPASFIYIILKVITYLLIRPEVGIFDYYMSPTEDVPLPYVDELVPISLIMFLARAFYLVSYFTWGCSLGHKLVGAHVIDRKTGRRMNTRQKLVRGLVQMLSGSSYLLIDALSLFLILVDRQERRSVYDWLAGTVVVVGDLPPEPEPAARRSWIGELSNALRGRASQETR